MPERRDEEGRIVQVTREANARRGGRVGDVLAQVVDGRVAVVERGVVIRPELSEDLHVSARSQEAATRLEEVSRRLLRQHVAVALPRHLRQVVSPRCADAGRRAEAMPTARPSQHLQLVCGRDRAQRCGRSARRCEDGRTLERAGRRVRLSEERHVARAERALVGEVEPGHVTRGEVLTRQQRSCGRYDARRRAPGRRRGRCGAGRSCSCAASAMPLARVRRT